MATAGTTRTIEIGVEVGRLIDEAMQAGSYDTPQELIAEVLRERRADLDDLGGYAPDELNRLLDEAGAGGPSRPADFEQIRREVRRRAGAED